MVQLEDVAFDILTYATSLFQAALACLGLICTSLKIFLNEKENYREPLPQAVVSQNLNTSEAEGKSGQPTQPTTTSLDPGPPVPSSCKDPFVAEFVKQRKFVCCEPLGRLGNMMFIFASAYGIAAKANRTVLVTKNHPLLKFFDLKAVKVNSFCMCRGGAVEVNEKKHSAFELKVFQLTRPVNYFPRMYLQSWKYFNHVADDIRKQFTFKDDIRNKALDILKQATKTNSSVVTVGIHIRRGDISDQKLYVNHGYIVPTPSYFKKAMDIFRKKYKDVMFVVCSNDMRWSKANINGNDVFFAEGKSAEVDMAILANCYHSIMSAGTFSWWAAFLSGGDAVHYKYPARNGSKFRAEFSEDFSDYFLPGWLGIE